MFMMQEIKNRGGNVVGGRRPAQGRWWETAARNSTEDYINELENLVDVMEKQIAKIEGSSDYALVKSKVLLEFFRDITVTIAHDELVFLCLRLAGVRYAAISDIVGSMSRSSSTIQRKVERAKAKLSAHFAEDNVNINRRSSDK